MARHQTGPEAGEAAEAAISDAAVGDAAETAAEGGAVPADRGDGTPELDQRATNRLLERSLARTLGTGLTVPIGWLLAVLLEQRWPLLLLLVPLGLLWFLHGPPSLGRVPASASAAVQLGVVVLLTNLSAGRPDWPLAILGGLIAGSTVIVEQPLGRLATLWVPFVSRMPGLTPVPRPVGRGRLGRRVRLGAIALGVVAAVAGLPAWIWLAAAAVTAVYPVLVLVRSVQRIRAGRRIRRSLRAAMAAYAPEFVIYTSRPDDASYQILMWLPYLQRTGRRFVIVARTNTAAAAIAAVTEDPVVTCRGVRDLEDIIQPSLRAAFYVNASSGNGALVRFKQLTHVYLGHGDSDKPPSYNPTHAMYDQVFAAGEAAIERYADHGVVIAREKFRIVGRPQVEGVERPEQPTATPRIALYAPTWRGHVAETLLYSLPSAERIVAALLERGLTVIFRPHPFSYDFVDDVAVIGRVHAMLAADAGRTGRAHLFGPAAESEHSITDCVNLSDVMVSDVSSVVSDYLFSEKPFAMVAVPCPPERFVEEYPVARASYVVDVELRNLGSVLDAMLGPDPMREDRRRTRSHYLGDAPPERYAETFVRACADVISAPHDADVEAADDTLDDASAEPVLDRLRAQFAVYGRDAGVAGLALLGVLVGATASPGWAAAIPLALIGLIMVGGRRAFTSRTSLDRLVGTVAAARVLLVIGLAVLWTRQLGLSWPVALSVLVLVATTAGEVTLRVITTVPGTGVANMPELASPPRPRMPSGVVFAADLGTLTLGQVLLLLGGPDWLLLVAAVSVVPFAFAARSGVGRIERLAVLREQLPAAVAAYRPRFAVYFGSAIGADYQVGMWLPYFHRIGAPFVIVTRTMGVLRVLAALDDAVPVIFRPSLRSLEDVVVPGMTTAFYVNNAVRNTHFIERRELTHVWLNHGDSEKPACYNPVHAIYDRLFVAGQAGIDRYARHGVHIPADKFQIVGRPQVERITPPRGPIASLTEPTVLYAPTWKGPYADSRVYSLPVGEKIVAGLLERGVRVIFRAHPFNQRFAEARTAMRSISRLLEQDRRATGRAHLWGSAAEQEMSVEECFNASDAMVADVSAVVSDYLKAQKPFAMVAVGQTPPELVAVAPAARAAYILRDDLSNLTAVLDDLLGADPLAPVRRESRVYYLSDLPDEGYADGFLDAARALVGDPNEVVVADVVTAFESPSVEADRGA